MITRGPFYPIGIVGMRLGPTKDWGPTKTGNYFSQAQLAGRRLVWLKRVNALVMLRYVNSSYSTLLVPRLRIHCRPSSNFSYAHWLLDVKYSVWMRWRQSHFTKILMSRAHERAKTALITGVKVKHMQRSIWIKILCTDHKWECVGSCLYSIILGLQNFQVTWNFIHLWSCIDMIAIRNISGFTSPHVTKANLCHKLVYEHRGYN